MQYKGKGILTKPSRQCSTFTDHASYSYMQLVDLLWGFFELFFQGTMGFLISSESFQGGEKEQEMWLKIQIKKSY